MSRKRQFKKTKPVASFNLCWYSLDKNDFAGEQELPRINQQDFKNWFFIPQYDFLGDCYMVQASQRQHLMKITNVNIDLNNYDYFVNVYFKQPEIYNKNIDNSNILALVS